MLRIADQWYGSDVGRQRQGNEDNFFVRAPLFVVADGMGGANAGEVASEMAVRSFDPELPGGNPAEALVDVIEGANRRIHDRSQSDESSSGMGTTVTAAYVSDEEVIVAHVGDSRAYLLRDGELQRLTTDHSLVGELVARGKLTEAQAESHPQRSVITRALGPEAHVTVDVDIFPGRPGDVFLLCSDGLTSMVHEPQLKPLFEGADDLETLGRKLIEAANAAGGRDNITVILFRLEAVEPREGAATEAAAAAATLLRNDGLLPLSVDSAERIAVIGAHAVVPRIQGGGSAGVDPLDVDEPLAALRVLAGERVSFAPGYEIAQTDHYQELSAPDRTAAARLRAEAVATARQADVIVAFVGLPLSAEVEAADRHDLSLPADQLDLLAELCDLGKPLVVVLAAGSAVDLAPWHDEAAAILLTWLGGEAVGAATAQVLFGAREPGGRLGETYPLALEQTPGYADFPGVDGHVRYDEGPFIGYRWYDAHGLAVRYPFGHGLSYTRFEYSDATIEPAEGGVRVNVTVTNTEDRAGSEVVQLYVEPPSGSDDRPPRELRGFAKVHLEPEGFVQATFELGVRDFAVADPEDCCWRQDAGTYRVLLAASSRDPKVTLEVERPSDRTSFAEPKR